MDIVDKNTLQFLDKIQLFRSVWLQRDTELFSVAKWDDWAVKEKSLFLYGKLSMKGLEFYVW